MISERGRRSCSGESAVRQDAEVRNKLSKNFSGASDNADYEEALDRAIRDDFGLFKRSTATINMSKRSQSWTDLDFFFRQLLLGDAMQTRGHIHRVIHLSMLQC